MAQPSSWPSNRRITSSYRVPETSFTTGRRQNRSCDQCRKGKRACDIVIHNDNIHSITGSCSNCAKTGKTCSFEWLRSKDGLLPRRQKQSAGKASDKHKVNNFMHWNRDVNEYKALQSHESPRFSLGPNDNLDISLPPSPYFVEQNFGQRPQHQSSSFGSASDGCQVSEINTAQFGFQDTEFYDFNGAALLQPPQNDGIARTTAENISKQFESALDNDPTQVNQKNRRGQRRRIRRTSVAATSASLGTGTKPSSRTSKTTPSILNARSLSLADPSSANIEYRLASSASKSSISGSLMKIYHDSMENALSCWLTERTCPYNVEVPLNTYRALTSDPMGQEWGSVWSNRICQRVCRLDNVCFNLRGRSLTRSEDEVVEMALRKTIMAFATQWAHSSARSAAEFPQMDSEESPFFNPRSSESASVEFDRSMQEMFWHQARQALGDTAGITSFRVVFAHMIFAMTHKPLDVPRHLQKLNSGNVASAHSFENNTMSEFDDAANTNTSAFGSFATQSISMSHSPNLAPGSKRNEEGGQHSSSASASASLDQILELSGPPIFLETALRQMFSFRCKLENLDSERWAKIKRNQDGIQNVMETHATPQTSESLLSASDRHTFNLLFWLAIMFDTLSAAMNKRPLVVSDEDSDILEDRSLAVDKPNPGFESNRFQDANVIKAGCDSRDSTGSDSRLWGQFFLHQNNLQQRQNIARWPCSYETAAATLCDAAPIKVLMYRRVTRLQTILSRRTGPEKLEIAIRDALAIHDYWNSKYAPFIRDCVSHHETLPPRIQSWYVVLAGHWHLAGLLLADIIEGVDETKSGLDTHRVLRSSTQLVRELRLDNAFAISDLGRCSSPNPDSTFPQAKEFHTAVNKGALLTEPWTEVLIRSFSKACSVLLEMFPSATQQGIRDCSLVEKLQAHCESCIQALWYLGKKSDVAFLASSVLSTSVRDKIESSRRNFNHTPQDIRRYGEREMDGTIDNISGLGSWSADESLTFDFSDVSLDAGFFKF